MRRRQGYTLIELVLVMFLLILIAFYVFTLTGIGSQTYLRLNAKQNETSDLRIGLSYINVQVRKHDAADALSIRKDPFEGGPALVVSQVLDGETYLTWIYIHDGYLCELFVADQAKVTPEMASKIAAADELHLESGGSDALKVTLVRYSDNGAEERSRVISLKSGGISP
ncbi:MAG: DUF4860 domain-containing protein [Clostridiaceae bacterium]|nr:DUF4860 domain-containing protein [Clostridiaceae bacterium]